ncbi:hypothetical protein Tco_0331536, partial [Tanacetum coccineum]
VPLYPAAFFQGEIDGEGINFVLYFKLLKSYTKELASQCCFLGGASDGDVLHRSCQDTWCSKEMMMRKRFTGYFLFHISSSACVLRSMVVEWVIDLSSQNAADIKRVLDRSSTEFRLNKLLVTGILDWLGNGSQWVVLYMSGWSELYRHTCYLFFSSVILDWLGVSKATELTASVSKAAEMQKLLQGNPLLLSTYYDMKGFSDILQISECISMSGSEDYNQAEDYEDYVEARDDV